MTNIPLLWMPVIVAAGMTFVGGCVYLFATFKRNKRQFADPSGRSSLRNR